MIRRASTMVVPRTPGGPVRQNGRGHLKPCDARISMSPSAFPGRWFLGSSDRTRGYLAVVLAAVLFGIWPSLSKLVLNELHPLVIGFLVQFVPAVALSPTIRGLRLSRAEWRLVLLATLSGSVAGPILYFYGLERTTASNSVLLSNSESLFTIILAYAFLGERATRREYMALGGIATGAFLVTTQLRFGDVRFLEFLIATGVFAPILVLSGTPIAIPISILPLVIALALSAVGGFSVLFLYAVRTIGAMRTGAVLPTSALWGILLALYLFPTDTLSGVQLLGGALMIGSLVAFYLFRAPAEEDVKGETLKPVVSDGPDSH